MSSGLPLPTIIRKRGGGGGGGDIFINKIFFLFKG